MTPSPFSSTWRTDVAERLATLSNEFATAVSYGPQTLTEPQKAQARGNIGVPQAIGDAVSGNMSGRAYPRTAAGAALDFNWGQVQAQPRHILGAATDSPDVRPYAPSAITVGSASWAEAAGRANALTGGWTPDYIQNQLNWRVTDTRFNGYIEHNFIVPETGNFPNEVPGANGYTVTGIWMWAPGRNIGVSFRQPQIHIPNVGWRALGSW